MGVFNTTDCLAFGVHRILCNPDEDNLVAYVPLSAEIVGDIVLPLLC